MPAMRAEAETERGNDARRAVAVSSRLPRASGLGRSVVMGQACLARGASAGLRGWWSGRALWQGATGAIVEIGEGFGHRVCQLARGSLSARVCVSSLLESVVHLGSGVEGELGEVHPTTTGDSASSCVEQAWGRRWRTTARVFVLSGAGVFCRGTRGSLHYVCPRFPGSTRWFVLR